MTYRPFGNYERDRPLALFENLRRDGGGSLLLALILWLVTEGQLDPGFFITVYAIHKASQASSDHSPSSIP